MKKFGRSAFLIYLLMLVAGIMRADIPTAINYKNKALSARESKHFNEAATLFVKTLNEIPKDLRYGSDWNYVVQNLDICLLDAWSAYNRTCRFTNHQFSLCQFFLQQLIRSRFTELVYKEKRISAGKIYHIRIFKNRLYR